jgi:ADP-ribose diphosphatase
LSDIFLPSPFDDPEILGRILGEPGLPDGRPATLDDHALASDEHGLRVALVPEAGAAVAGGLFPASAGARARLDFAMAALGAARVPVAVAVPGGPVAAEAYRFAPEAAPPGRWSSDGPAERRGRQAEALDEIMGHFGRRDPGELPALLHGIGIRALGRCRGTAGMIPVRLGAGLHATDVEPVERVLAYARYFGIEEHRLRHRRFDGAMSDLLERAVFTSGDAVTVLPYDPRADAVLLIEQFRAGPHARRDPRPWCLEAVAGRCDRTEPPELTARREAGEEAGLELGRLERIAAYYPSPGIMSEYITAFVGEADLAAAGGVHGLADEHEDIRAIVVPLGAALASAATGEINNAPLLLSLFWLEHHAERLRRAWT